MNFQIKSFEEYEEKYKQSVEDPSGFWDEIAREYQWRSPWEKTFESDFSKPEVEWFTNAKLNITENCLDRHLEERGNKLAIIWEPTDPKEKFIRWT